MSDQTLKLVAALRARIESTRRRLALLDATGGLLLSIGVLLSLWFISVLLEAGFWLSPVARTALLVTVIVSALIPIFLFVVKPIARFLGWFGRFTEHHVAGMIGSVYPEVSDRMINFLQLSEGAHSHAPSEMLDRAVAELGEKIQPIRFEGVASTAPLKRIARFTLLPLAAVIIFVGASPSTFVGASERLLAPGTTFSKPAPFSIRVIPGDLEVIRGDSVEVSALIEGSGLPPKVELEYEYDGEIRSRIQSLESDDAGVYSFVFAGIRQSLHYRFLGGPVESAWYNLTVVVRPVVQRLDISLHAPSYTRLPVQQLESNVGDISAVTGTVADVEVLVSGTDPSTAKIIFANGGESDLVVDGRKATGSLEVTATTSYHFEIAGPEGVTNSDPITYEIAAIEDTEPTISFVYPNSQSELSDDALLPFGVRFSDDFGFSSLHLFYRVAESRFSMADDSFSSVSLPLNDPYLLDQIFEYEWSLREDSGLDPIPGDVIEYYVRVRDNNRVTGVQSAVTPTFTTRFPSLAEQYEQLDSAQEETETGLEDLLDEAQDIRDQFQQLKEDLRQQPESDWQDERRLEQLQQRQQDLESSVEQISEGIQEMTDDMSRNDLVSDETLDLFQELREVVDEVNSPELMDALRDLENSLENMDLARMQENLEDFEFNEQMYMERLDRALELFKNLRLQQDLEEAQRRAEDLSEREDQIQEETAGLQNENKPAPEEEARDGIDPDEEAPPPGNEEQQRDAGRLAQEQEQAARDMEALEEKLEQIRERMEEMNSPAADRMQDLEEDTKDREIPEQMEKTGEQIREENFSEALENQKQIQNQLDQIPGQLGEMQQNMQGQQLQLNLAGLRATLADILTLSERQESLRLDVVSIRSDSPRLRIAAEQQIELSEGLTMVADSLQALARKIPQMGRDVQQLSGDAMRDMGSAVDALTDRSSRNASGYQKGAMTDLNELALILSDLLDQMMNSSSSSGSGMNMEQLMQQLQQMGEQQQQLNDQIQQILNDAQGNRLTSDMIERMRQLGSQQEQIRRDLKQMNRDRSVRNKLLGDLNRLAEQMEESVQDLVENRMTRQLMQWQRQILTRLLEASRSLQEKGQERQRESRTGADLDRASPADLTPSEQIEKLRRELFRALESGYSPDYELLIRRYFEMLQQQSKEIQ